MLFNSLSFLWMFLPILLIIYFFASKKYRNLILLIFSLFFYAWGEPKYIILMILSIIVNYIFGRLINKAKEKRQKTWQRVWLALDLLTNIGMLAYFKYFNFLVTNVNNVFGAGTLNIGEIALPIGISFYTFQIMSYIIDLYRGEIKVQKNILKLALYISFFPQLIAGPIVKYKDIDDQLDNREITLEKFSYGVRRFVYGLAKKILIADSMAAIVDTIFAGGTGSLEMHTAWIGAICYALQIFFDFSGYSDMAIGLGAMFGFIFPENFNLPYISGSVTEFWRRWHISLSTWFKEYLYIPLGGNRKGKIRTYTNLWIVFIATGIWHGAAWTFVVWGLFHGFFMFIERLGLKKVLDRCKIINHIYLLLVMLVGWVIFRAPHLSDAMQYIKVMFTGQITETPIQLYNVVNVRTIIAFVLAVLLSGPIQIFVNKIKVKNSTKQLAKAYFQPFIVIILLVLCVFYLVNNTYSTFIYFRF